MDKYPVHVAIIMDGNGRWAEQRGLPRIAGHKAGLEAVKKVIRACLNHQVKVLSLFAFSSENWIRPKSEIDFLMQLFLTVLKREIRKLHQNNVQLRVIGNRTKLSLKLQNSIDEAERLTQKNTGLKLAIAVDYGGCWDVCQAVKSLAKQIELGQLSSEDITEKVIHNQLALADWPHPDLFIRTSGEVRLSNFFLLQLAYTELYFTRTLWPDFNEDSLEEALADFASRQRRYGGTDLKVGTMKRA